MTSRPQDHLDRLESQSVFLLREAYASFPRLCMLWSIGKDSTVLLWLARKAFFGHVPFPLVHVDTSFKIPEMIMHRDRLARDCGVMAAHPAESECEKPPPPATGAPSPCWER